MIDAARLLPGDLLPPSAAKSARQEALLDGLSAAGAAEDARRLARRGMQALDPQGLCAGLAYRGPDGTMLLAMFLRSVIEFPVDGHPAHAAPRAAALAAVGQLDAALHSIADQKEWRFLQLPPRSFQNRILHFHCAILEAPVYPLIAARLQRGIAAKAAQLANLPPDAAGRRLGGFLQGVIPIVRGIPAPDTGGLPDNFDAVVRTAILHLRRRRAGRFAHARYAPASYKVFWNNWAEMYYARAQGKDFQSRHALARRSSGFSKSRGMEDEDLAADARWEEELERLLELERQEEREIGIPRREPGAVPAPAQRGGLDPGRAVVQLTPSATLPGSRPRVILALIDAGLDALEEEWAPLNAAAARGLVDCMLYLGRRPEWLLRLRLGRNPASVRDCVYPVLDPVRWIIHHRPDIYPGMPEYLLPPSSNNEAAWKKFEREWKDHDAVYEKIDLVHQIIMPDPLRAGMRSLSAARRAALRNCSARKKAEITPDQFWVWQERGNLVPLTFHHAGLILDRLTEILRRQIPSYPRLEPAHLCRSFEGHFSGYGLRPEYSYSVSGRMHPASRMALRYSRVPGGRISREHALAAASFQGMLRTERAALGCPPQPQKRARASSAPAGMPDASHTGSWRCARSDLVRLVLAELQDAVRTPGAWDPDLPRRQALLNARTRLAAFGLALLCGLRPVELARLRCQDIDLEEHWIAIRGKQRPDQAAYRRLPVLPGMSRLLEEVIRGTGRPLLPRRRLLGFYKAGSVWRAASVEDLENILIEAGGRQGLSAVFDLYGLRHRFRTDGLEVGIPFRLLNYLMGHESVGFEAFGIYQDAGPGPVQAVYQESAAILARTYGWEQ